MNENQRFSGAIVAVVLFGPVSTAVCMWGQASPSQKAISAHTAIVAFKAEGENLPPHFSGGSVPEIYAQIRQRFGNPHKSEFETETQYELRTAKFQDGLLQGNTRVGDLFGFVLGQASTEHNRVYGTFETAYDADSKWLTVTIPFDLLADKENYARLGIDAEPFLLHQERVLNGTHVGSNAYGARASVNRWTATDTDLVVQDLDFKGNDCFQNTPDGLVCNFMNIDISVARTFSRSPRAVMVGHLTAPFISSGAHTIEATIDHPGEIRIEERYLHFVLDEIWFFDSLTGHVLKRVTATAPPVNGPPTADLPAIPPPTVVSASSNVSASQTVRGHRIGESAADFFKVEPLLKTKLMDCQSNPPRELTPEEIKSRYGKKVLKEYQSKKAMNDTDAGHVAIVDKDPDVYGDKCGALLGVLTTGHGHFDGNGYDTGNPYSVKLFSRSASEHNVELMPYRKADLDNRWFVFEGGALVSLR